MYTQLGYAYAYITDTQTKASPNRKQDSKLERRGFIDDILESLGNGNLGPVITEQPVGAGDGAAQATVTVTVTETAPAGAVGGDQAYVEKKDVPMIGVAGVEAVPIAWTHGKRRANSELFSTVRLASRRSTTSPRR